MKNKISVLIADDNVDFVDLFYAYIQRQPEFTVIGRAGNGQEAYDLITRNHPDIVLLDLCMPGMNGIDLLKKLNGERFVKQPSVIILSAVSREEITREVLDMGACYYMIKPFEPEQLLERMRMIVCYAEEARAHELYMHRVYRESVQRQKQVEIKVCTVLKDLGVSPRTQGYVYLKDSVFRTMEGGLSDKAEIKQLYAELARLYDTTPVCVERAIRYAKQCVYKSPQTDLEAFFEECSTYKDEIPSNMEFIQAIRSKILRENSGA